MSHAYTPPAASLGRLGATVSLLKSKRTREIDHSDLTGARFMCRLPGGQLYYDSKLDLDTDGSRFAAQDGTGQSKTSLRYADGKSVDADAVPYFVLPGGFYHSKGISLGDVAVVIYQARIEYAVFADVGPEDKIGEGSIALHRSLGHETVIGGRLNNIGITRDVITIVFPGSGNRTPQTPELIRVIGERLFTLLSLTNVGDFDATPLPIA